MPEDCYNLLWYEHVLTVLLHWPKCRPWSRTSSLCQQLSPVAGMPVNPGSFGIHHLLWSGLIPKPNNTETFQTSTYVVLALSNSNTKNRIKYIHTSATPKSHIFTVSSVVRRRFPGLMSLWTTPLLCKYSKPSISWTKYLKYLDTKHEK